MQNAGCRNQCPLSPLTHVLYGEWSFISLPACQRPSPLSCELLTACSYAVLSWERFRPPKGFRRNGFRGNSVSATMTFSTILRNSEAGRVLVVVHGGCCYPAPCAGQFLNTSLLLVLPESPIWFTMNLSISLFIAKKWHTSPMPASCMNALKSTERICK